MSISGIVYLAAFPITVTLIVILRPLASVLGAVDHPGGRKRHRGPVPVVGGLGIFGGISFGVLLSSDIPPPLAFFVGIAALLVVVGFIDDVRGLSAMEKLAAQIGAVALMVGVAGLRIENLGLIGGSGVLLTDWWSIGLTIFAAVGLINAINMVDGMDGLAAGISGFALLFFGVAALIAGEKAGMDVAFLALFSVLGFLVFNVGTRRGAARVFMGDAGSLVLGFVLVWLAIRLSQGAYRAITPVAAVWILAVPLLDAVTVMLRRILEGRSPFSADRYHLHHLLLNQGFTVSQALIVILGVSACSGAIGLSSAYFEVSEKSMLIAFLSLFVFYFFATSLVKAKQTRNHLDVLLRTIARDSMTEELAGSKMRLGRNGERRAA